MLNFNKVTTKSYTLEEIDSAFLYKHTELNNEFVHMRGSIFPNDTTPTISEKKQQNNELSNEEFDSLLQSIDSLELSL